mmetsp:Transcript_2383/g.9204  ORF Transcript_2383/g.9204 Transcript_2383/m.9204 type:complete len:260 (+) Transcript_2383:1297-2076(+)
MPFLTRCFSIPGDRSMASNLAALNPRAQIMFAKTPVPAPTSNTSFPWGGQNERNVSTHAFGDAKPSFSSESCSYASAHVSYAPWTCSLGVLNREDAIFCPSKVVSSAILMGDAGDGDFSGAPALDDPEDSPPMLHMDNTESLVCIAVSRGCVSAAFARTGFGTVFDNAGIRDTAFGDAPLSRPNLFSAEPAKPKTPAASARAFGSSFSSFLPFHLLLILEASKLTNDNTAEIADTPFKRTLKSTERALRISPLASSSFL